MANKKKNTGKKTPGKKPTGKKKSKRARGTTCHVSGAVPYQPRMSKSGLRTAVGTQLGTRIKLANFRSTVTPLTPDEREILIAQALELLETVYAHLPLKRALHANDPIQSLRLLRLRQAGLDERAFQSAMMDVFLGLRDLHTNYILPTSYA